MRYLPLIMTRLLYNDLILLVFAIGRTPLLRADKFIVYYQSEYNTPSIFCASHTQSLPASHSSSRWHLSNHSLSHVQCLSWSGRAVRVAFWRPSPLKVLWRMFSRGSCEACVTIGLSTCHKYKQSISGKS